MHKHMAFFCTKITIRDDLCSSCVNKISQPHFTKHSDHLFLVIQMMHFGVESTHPPTHSLVPHALNHIYLLNTHLTQQQLILLGARCEISLPTAITSPAHEPFSSYRPQTYCLRSMSDRYGWYRGFYSAQGRAAWQR